MCTQYTGYAEGAWVVNVVTVIGKNFQCRQRYQAFGPSFSIVDDEAIIGSQKKCNSFRAIQLHNKHNFNLVFPALFLLTPAVRCVPVGTSHPWLA